MSCYHQDFMVGIFLSYNNVHVFLITFLTALQARPSAFSGFLFFIPTPLQLVFKKVFKFARNIKRLTDEGLRVSRKVLLKYTS